MRRKTLSELGKLVLTDGGKEAAGFHRERNDCVVRAMAIAAGLSYKDAHDLARWAGRQEGFGLIAPRVYDSLFRRLDLPSNGFRYTTVNKALQMFGEGSYIFRIPFHVFAVIDGKVYDSFEVSRFKKLTAIWKVN